MCFGEEGERTAAMKITFLIRSLNYGGAERQLIILAKGLHDCGHSISVAVFYQNGPLEKDLHNYGVPVHVLDKQGRWDIFCFLFRLIRLLRHEKPDILHGYLGIPNIFTVLLKPVFPHIRMIWGVRASYMDLDRYDWLVRLSYRVECRLSRFADLIIVNSYAGLNLAIANGFPKNKMVVIPNGIDTERFQPDLESRKRVRAEWGIRANEKLMGLVGRLDPMKDHPTFLKAAALLAQERQDIRFVCVGDGPEPYKSELYTLARNLGLDDRLIWAGARNDMAAVYNALDVISSSSYGEGFSNVIGEAMACGVPCVVTDVGDSALIVSGCGVVVPPKNIDALSAGWRKLIMEKECNGSNISLTVRTKIISEFSHIQLIQRTLDALKNTNKPTN